MTETTYTFTLSLDGHHTVTVSGTDPNEVQEAMANARGIFLKLKGFAAEQREQDARDPSEPPSEPPVCPIHGQPMTWQHGRKGFFWSCHNRKEDNSWCDYKPEEAP